MIGTNLSQYRILEKLGEGGMGEVYVAEDTKLNRKVALKLLPTEMASDPERLARFEREAKAVAALNHPNIVTIYSVEEFDGAHFLTMEFVQGKNLSEVIPKGGLALGRFFDLAVPTADALSAAHEQGITHRDLKPGNIMVSDAGRVKILDFGLAKLAAAEGTDAGEQPTKEITQAGRILGTVPYMSPEQAQGKPLDHRSDIFSLGVILYQMATGDRPFTGQTSADLISSILRDTPSSVTQLKAEFPRHLGRIIRHCLQKDPKRRYQSALDLRNELEELKREIESGEVLPTGEFAAAAPRTRRPPWIFPAIAAAVLLAVVATWFLRPAGRPADVGPLTASFTQLTDQAGIESFPNLSPDGRFLVYESDPTGNTDIYLQRVGGRNPINLTEGSTEDDSEAAFSPDGGLIAFRSERDGGGIFVMGATGESVRRLTDVGYNPAWSPEGTEIVFSTQNGSTPLGRGAAGELWIVDVSSGEERRIFEGDAVHPHWSPGGHRIAFWGLRGEKLATGQRDLWTIRADGSEPVAVTEDVALDWNPVWSPDGEYLYFSSDRGGSMNLWRVAVDEASGRVLHDPQPITTPSRWSGPLSLSGVETQIAYVAMDQRSNIEKVELDPSSGTLTSSPTPVTQGSVQFIQPDVSPDGEWVVFRSVGGQEDVFLARSDGSDLRQLTDDIHRDRRPRWSPDGSRIAFYSNRGGSYEVWTIHPDGSGLQQVTETPGNPVWQCEWSPDGARIAASNELGSYIFEVADSPQKVSEVLPRLGETESFIVTSWSPDGKRLAGYRQVPGPAAGIYVYSFETSGYEVLEGFETSFGAAEWLSDSRRLVVVTEGRLHLVDVVSGDVRELMTLAQGDFGGGWLAVADDDRSIYVQRQSAEADIWLATLE